MEMDSEKTVYTRKRQFSKVSVNGDTRPEVSDGRPYKSSVVQVWQEFSSLDFQVGNESPR